MNLLKIADVPATMVTPDTSVNDAVKAMVKNHVGAVAVVEDGQMRGIFTERDVMVRVVLPNLDQASTKVSQVMTASVESINDETAPIEALELMVKRHFRHLPIMNGNGRIKGMISIRNLLQGRIESLSHELESLEAYLTADGIGG